MNKINKKILGIWLFFLTDCIMFLCFFLSFYLSKNIFFLYNKFYNYRIILIETILLLLCSFLSLKYLKNNKKKYIFLNIFFSFIFLILEYKDYIHLKKLNLTNNYNNYFSNYYLIISFHALHVIFSIFFSLNIIFIRVVKFNFKIINIMYSLFWHFIHIIWLCLVFIIYLKK
ncbi:cytochrome O ubiquinol oxidase subunit III [Candidatus Carsonella ruddii CS isolate Thao2000]|uniref:cytochrome-c oxidase n=1 Tax=Candidatus Carsonella ruddii CS isolate Thao2000 TaxID=1202537 RepID=J7GWK4_CARRU|nr:cytochrome o ubiquinol oxidase subunit III [Candidatus Carsonella ruddii]AFP83841.1 cytochrome O ubiquinol oxidase subunit III [Candidatus Carsonella ruddii CS isolate Thao2000]